MTETEQSEDKFQQGLRAFQKTIDERNTAIAELDATRQELAAYKLRLESALRDLQIAETKIAESDARANVAIADRAYFEAFLFNVQAMLNTFELPADPLRSIARKNGGRKRDKEPNTQAAAAVEGALNGMPDDVAIAA